MSSEVADHTKVEKINQSDTVSQMEKREYIRCKTRFEDVAAINAAFECTRDDRVRVHS